MAISKVDADSQDIFQLARSIGALKDAGRRTTELEGAWWHKLSSPFSAVLMPLLGAIAAFGLARSGQLLIRAVIGMALGFAYFVVDNAALAMGNFGGYPPLVAGARRIGAFDISVAVHPEKHPASLTWAHDVENFKKKLAAGASRGISQFF